NHTSLRYAPAPTSLCRLSHGGEVDMNPHPTTFAVTASVLDETTRTDLTMEHEPLLMIPGPVPVPQRVRAAMTRQAINHRGPEFGAAYADCVRILKTLFGTTNELYIISG